MAMPSVQFFRERYCRRVVRDLPEDLEPEEWDVLGILKARVAKDLSMRSAPPGTAAWSQKPRFHIPGSPPSSRLVSSEGLRSFHLGVNKTAERPARSFDRYAASKAVIAAAIDDQETHRALEQAGPAIYDTYAIGHGGETEQAPDHHTNLCSDPDVRASQWDAIEQYERSLRLNCKPGPSRIAIYYERAPELFDRAAPLSGCPSGLRALIQKEQRRVAAGKPLSERNKKLGVAWIDDAAPLAQAWLERLPGWDTIADTGNTRLVRVSAGRGVQTHVSGEIEYPAALAGDPNARRNIRLALGGWFDSQRNAGDDVASGSILPFAIFDHAPDRLNDPRNRHCHFLAGTRRVVAQDDGSLTFAEHKVDAISRKGFHERLRAKFAELANIELARIDAAYRLHPGTHAEMGIHGAEAQRKLFGRAVVLERASVPTTYGLANDIEGWRRAFESSSRRRQGREAKIAGMATADAVKNMLRRAALLRFQAEEIALLVAMAVSRAKRTARFAPSYSDAAKRDKDKQGWLARDAEARNHLSELNSELALERGAIKERRHQAARLERAAATAIAREAVVAQDAARDQATGHRAIDLIARAPLLISEHDGRFFVDSRDDVDGQVTGIDLHAPDLQRRLASLHDAQRKALKQVQAFVNKHGHGAMFDEAKIGRTDWLRASIEQWRSSPAFAREASDRQARADAHRAMLTTRHRRWARDRDNIDTLVAEGSITLLAEATGAVEATTDVQTQDVTTQAPVAPLAAPVPILDEWRPGLPRPILDAVAARWRDTGMDAFASDIAGFEHVLSARPDPRWIADVGLVDALGSDASCLTKPVIHHRLTAIWLYQEMTRRDLIASRDIENYIPHPAPAEGSWHARLLADRNRHAGDAVLAAMFEKIGAYDAGEHQRNRMVRATLAAIQNNEDQRVCRMLADAAIAQPDWLKLRQQMPGGDLKTLWAASSMPSKGIYANMPKRRRSHGILPTRPGRDLR